MTELFKSEIIVFLRCLLIINVNVFVSWSKIF